MERRNGKIVDCIYTLFIPCVIKSCDLAKLQKSLNCIIYNINKSLNLLNR